MYKYEINVNVPTLHVIQQVQMLYRELHLTEEGPRETMMQ